MYFREAVGLPGCLPKVKLSAQLRETYCDMEYSQL